MIVFGFYFVNAFYYIYYEEGKEFVNYTKKALSGKQNTNGSRLTNWLYFYFNSFLYVSKKLFFRCIFWKSNNENFFEVEFVKYLKNKNGNIAFFIAVFQK